jgi:hypothetical protein
MIKPRTLLGALALAVTAWALAGPSVAAVATCNFDKARLAFAGDARAQARCLLRPVRLMGALGPEQALPGALAQRLGEPTVVDRAALAKHLGTLPDPYAVKAAERLNQPVSSAGGKPALYFVIHDTSSPDVGLKPFPPGFDTDGPGNRLNSYLGANSKAHYFVNRLGEIAQGHDFATPWRATKLELNSVGTAARGRFLHIELIQPRRKEASHPGKYGFVAPDPGFTSSQYDSLALLYVVASTRAGKWMIPAYHAAVDAGLEDGHDDPQAFDLAAFDGAVTRLLGKLSAAPPAGSAETKSASPPAGATARWGDQNGRLAWTQAAWEAVDTLGPLLWADGAVPTDIAAYCPGYARQTAEGRKLFWVGLMSSLAKPESDFDPSVTYKEGFNDAQGRPVISRGLLQISRESANGYGCQIGKEQELHDPTTNLRCGARILNRLVSRSNVIAKLESKTWRGAAAYWSPFRKPDRRADVAGWVAGQPYCKAS